MKFYRYESYENRNGTWDYFYQPENGENNLPLDDFKPDQNGEYFRIPFTLWGDYVGDTVTRANYEWFMENHGTNSLVFDCYAGYNGHAIICHKSILEDEQIKELIEKLNDYPLFNDESVSQLESKLEYESWGAWVKYDLRRALDEAEIEYPENESELESLFWHCVQYNDIQFNCEDAVSASIDIEKVVEKWGTGFCPSCNSPLYSKGEHCENCPQMEL